jgi:hypothetical protein
MHRLTIPSMTALLVVLFAMAAQAQSAPGTPPQAPQTPQTKDRAGAAAHGAQAKSAMHPRVIMLHVDEVLAADTGEGIDVRLLPMGGRLESLFRYTTYRLISHQIGRAECGRKAAFTLPGGWIVNVEPSAVRDNMIAMELMLFNGTHPMLTTDVRLRNHSMFIIGGPHYRQGMLIIPIGADALELASPSGPLPVSPEGTMPEVSAPNPAASEGPDDVPPEMAPFDASAPDAAPPNAPNQ